MADLKLWNSLKYLKQPIPLTLFLTGPSLKSIRWTTQTPCVVSADDVWFDEAAMAPEEALISLCRCCWHRRVVCC